MTATIKQVLSTHAKHLESVRPGLPASFPEAATVGDCIVQGDLYLTITDRVPSGYVKQPPSGGKASRQLVPESGVGSHHRLDSLKGVTIHYPPGFAINVDGDSLEGPCLVLNEDRVIVHEPGHDHPHGPVTLRAGTIVHCTYQREWSKEEARERRARD